ncbi:hypothetical protein QOL99_00075 [Deinococcus sp. MIMF12]|uniref:Uncharacterized protein n=1 Tax=Deinococcus rhizophilus TaxID=3049544 RepID=A0ABT7JFS6_9DEIO|nr:hypothetical protein [Deinococcus rhizophilus]MDL2342544.1 hypothetical protein [Deinococcus rhizophilus]
MELQVIQALGVPGLLFLAAYVVAHVYITEFVKTVLARLGKVPRDLAVVALSLALGAGLGALLLGGLATTAGVTLAPPFAGMTLGVVLAVIASGYVAYKTRRQTAGVQAQATSQEATLAALFEALGRMQPAPVVVTTPPPQVTVEVPTTAQPLDFPFEPPPDFPMDDLRPMTPADVTQLGTDGPVR